ncbi:MAG: XdhC/CoxI family protein [Acidobacteriota bacterium]|nr:XdhC/CoxI family protein [Acidobacteriota bacterium]
MDIYEEISNLKRQGRRSALATIVNVQGSIPSATASKMLVRDDGSILGTIGGGCIENEVRKGAHEVMKDEKPRTFNFNLNQRPDDDTGLVCGGSLQVFIEPLIPSPHLYIFGAGHVGLNLYKVAVIAGFEVTVADDREEYANRERFPDALDIYNGDMDQIMSQLSPSDSSYIAIVTRGHQHDLRVLRWALDTSACYIGMIGSGRKVLTLFHQLEEEGVRREVLDKVYAPIGLQLGAVTPEEIAISVTAELIGLRRHSEAALPHSRHRIRKPEPVKEV